MVFQRTGGGYRVFCNPPYGRAITDWVEKAYREGTKDNTIVVMLIPARTDTRYFHDFIQHRSEIRFVKGRLKFGKQQTGSPIPFNGSYIQGCWNVGGKRMSRPTKTCYDCKNACWDSVPYGSTTATMFGGCDKAEEMTEEEAERFGETEDCPFWENRYKEENA